MSPPKRARRRTVLLVATAAAVLVAALGLWVRASLRRDTRRLAEPLLGCPADQITVTSSDSDTETYEVEGCGKEGKMYCPGPDFECFIDRR